jgi:DNA-binding response OmpR family regulator
LLLKLGIECCGTWPAKTMVVNGSGITYAPQTPYIQSATDAKRILLVDQDRPVRESLRHALTLERYEVLTAADGTEARQRMTDTPADLVLLDLDLDGEEGAELLRDLTAERRQLPVIATTTRCRERAVADAVMEKPFEMPVLLQTMESLLAEQEQAQLNRIVAAIRALKSSGDLVGDTRP